MEIVCGVPTFWVSVSSGQLWLTKVRAVQTKHANDCWVLAGANTGWHQTYYKMLMATRACTAQRHEHILSWGMPMNHMKKGHHWVSNNVVQFTGRWEHGLIFLYKKNYQKSFLQLNKNGFLSFVLAVLNERERSEQQARRITESQNGQGWTDHRSSSSPTSLLSPGHLQDITQDCAHIALEYLHGRRLHNLSGNYFNAWSPLQ